MTTEYTKYEYDNPNSHFGGTIKETDFDTTHLVSRDMANRIVSDWSFDKQCQKNEEERKRNMEWRKINEEITLHKDK